MDERQQQIREGAGLQESRLNTDFIDFVQKWGGPFLILCAVIMAAWAGWNWWQKRQAEQIDAAFAQYEAQSAGGNASPEALKAVAEEFEGIGSVSMLARLEAADVYVTSIRAGVKTGVTLSPDGTLASPDDALTQEERTRLIEQATALYQRVMDKAGGSSGKGLIAIRAGYGLAAMAECLGDIGAARGHYERVVEIAEANGFDNHVTLAKARLESLDEVATPVALLSLAELAVRPAPPAPELPAVPGDVGPAGPGLTGWLEQPVMNPFNPEGTPSVPSGGPAPVPGTEPGATPAAPEPAPAPEPATPGSEPGPAPGTEPAAEPSVPPTEPATPPGR